MPKPKPKAAVTARPARRDSEPKSVELVGGGVHTTAEAHTATFSTPAPSSKRSSASSPGVSAPTSDPFATGADNGEKDDGSGDDTDDVVDSDIAGGSTGHQTSGFSDSDDEAPPEDDFAAMLAAADDLQAL